jgi:alanine-glyoxylate transaminase/serine-glyoxylate transaminase/serine-pyruvate transaminase
MLLGTLAGVEMGLRAAGVPYRPGGVQAAMGLLSRPAAATDPKKNQISAVS